jgi:hypothetical protein
MLFLDSAVYIQYTLFFFKKGKVEIKRGPGRILTHTEELELQQLADQNPWGTCRNFGLEFGVSKSIAWYIITKCNKDAFIFKKPSFLCSETNLEQVINLQLSYFDR